MGEGQDCGDGVGHYYASLHSRPLSDHRQGHPADPEYSLSSTESCESAVTIHSNNYIYHVFINALSTHMICINLNMFFIYIYAEHTHTKTIDIK